MKCDQCGGNNPSEARFCSSCGRSLTKPVEERRVVTVLFADLVGFTTLAEHRDPEDVKVLVDQLFERLVRVVHDHGGQVDKIVGDAVVALFGAPVAHEDDAERAVRAALRMQDVTAEYAAETETPLHLRVGLNTGEVLTGALRAGGDYTAMGDVMNTASRLQTSAEPGQVRVAESTFRATHQVVAYEELGPLQAKGREAPVDVWVATSPLLPPGYRPRRRRTPLVGREAELDLLLTTARLSLRHRRGQTLVVVGEAGMGKQRLANELTDLLQVEDDVLVLAGRCVPYGEANPFWPLAEAIRSGFGVGRDAPREDAVAKLRAAVDAVADNLPRLQPEVVLDGLLHLLDYDGPLRLLEGARARTETTQSLLTFLEAVLVDQPVVLRLADLHWADETVLDMVDELTEQLARLPLVVVATSRTVLQSRWTPHPGRNNVVVLNLDPLERGASSRLLDTLGGDDLDPVTREMLLDRAGGNPFYLEELVTLVGQRGTLDAPVAELPDTLRGLVAARLDGLDPDEQAVIEDAAVWGPSGMRITLERMGEAIRGVGDVDGPLMSLAAKDVLVLDGDAWAFRSDVMREVAYSRLTRRDRLVRHAGTADRLEGICAELGSTERPDTLVLATARHFGEAAHLADELGEPAGFEGLTARAVRWVDEAGQVAEEAANWRLADQLMSQALDLVGTHDPAARLELLLSRSLVRGEQWNFVGAREDATEALALAEQSHDPVPRARAHLRLGQALMRSGEWAGSDQEFGSALAIYSAAGDVRGQAETMRQSGMAHLLRGDHVGAVEPIEGALDGFRALMDRRGEAWALQNLAWIAFVEGRADGAEVLALESEDAFVEVGDQGGLAWTRGLLAFIRFGQGDFETARELAAEVLHESERRGDAFGKGMMQLVEAGIELWSGHPAAASELIAEAVGHFRAVGDLFGLEQALALQGRALVMSGDVARGLEVLEEAAAVSVGTSTTFAAAVQTLLDVQLGRPVALSATESPHAATRQMDGTLSTTQPVAARSLALAQAGDYATALELARESVTSATGMGYERSALAMAEAAAGETEAVAAIQEVVLGDPRATYLDRLTVLLARALVDEPGGAAALARVRIEMGTVEDRVAEALVALATTVRNEALGTADPDEMAEADELLADVGMSETRWRPLFEHIATHLVDDD